MVSIPFAEYDATPRNVCRDFKRLDAMFGTSPLSPLHHDNRCPIHVHDRAHRAIV